MDPRRDWPVRARPLFAKDFMNFITTRAPFERAKAILAAKPQHRHHTVPPEPYAFLTARDLRGLVAAMVD
jgi:hypothetical protein